ncbi:MAG: hypothetical protein MZV63_49800 [Marinilabiliales bacterium]|nr:hypothetical protein [Marinilabiliales bacterium]
MDIEDDPDVLLLPAAWETTTIYYYYDYWYYWYGGYWGWYYPYYPPSLCQLLHNRHIADEYC